MPPELTITPASTPRATDARARRTARWPLIYFLLAAFDLIAIGGSLYLGHRVMGLFSSSLEVNQDWAERLGDLADINAASGAVNAPGNDVFDSLDHVGEAARQKAALSAFNGLMRDFATSIENVDEPLERETMRRGVENIIVAMAEMIIESNLIFSHFAARQPEEAGRRMATMDRKFAQVSQAIAATSRTIRDIQRAHFKEQVEHAAYLGRYEYFFGGLIALMVIAVVLYGHRIARAFKDHEIERAAHEARLEQLNRFLDELFQNTVDPLAAVDGDFKVIRINRAASELFGYRSEEIEGRPVNVLSPEIEALVRGTGEPGTPDEPRQIKGLRKDLTELPLDVATSAFDLAGARRYVVTLRDASQRLRAQDALVRSSRLMAVGDMTAALAHEFNSPLAAVQGNLALLRRLRARDNEVTELADDALIASRSIAGLVKRLMTVSQRQLLRPKPTDLRHFLESVQASFKGVIGNADLDLRPPSLPTQVNVDEEQLQLVLLGIATNAREVMPEIGGRLTIACQERVIAEQANLTEAERLAGIGPGRHAVIAVTDNGKGMTRAQITAAIEPFRATRPAGQGGGMELAVAHGFARQSGGALAVESKPGRGTTVAFYLPMPESTAQTNVVNANTPAGVAAE